MQEMTPKRRYNEIIELLQSGADGEAEQLCRQAVDDNGDVNFIALLGTILARRDDLHEAESYLRRAVQIAPAYPKANEELGSVLLNRGKPLEAIPFLRKATELSPSSAECFFKLGGALKLAGDNDGAAAAFAQSQRLSPSKAKLEEASRLFAAKKFREAEKLAQELILENPRDVNAALLLSKIAMDASCYADAETLLRRITRIAPRFITAWHELAAAVKEQHRMEETL